MAGPKERQGILHQALEKTGCLMIVDGSGDEKIQPKGPKDYVFNVELCIACNIASMFSMLSLQLSFVFSCNFWTLY